MRASLTREPEGVSRYEGRVAECEIGNVGEWHNEDVHTQSVGERQPEEEVLAEERFDAARLQRERHHAVEEMPVVDMVERRRQDPRHFASMPHLARAHADRGKWSDHEAEEAHVEHHEDRELSAHIHRHVTEHQNLGLLKFPLYFEFFAPFASDSFY